MLVDVKGFITLLLMVAVIAPADVARAAPCHVF